ncbi:hypothetical protein BHE74_00056925, partial [Ensete ventricosum]
NSSGRALAAAGRPLTGGLGRGIAVGGRPCMGAGRHSSSLPSLRKWRWYIPVFQIRMEKMKEVKRPPL